MELKNIYLIVVACLIVHVELRESTERKNRTIHSAICPNKACLMKIQSCPTGARTCKARVNGRLTTEPETRFTIVKVYKPNQKSGKCIEFTSASRVKYALKVNATNNIIFEEQQNGCNNKTSDDFIFTAARDLKTGMFTYTHNSRCLGTNINGTLSLMTNIGRKCSYRHFKWP